MELREAIEKLTMWHKANPRTGPLGVVMNAVGDGTLIPAGQCYEVREGYDVCATIGETDEHGWRDSDIVPLSEALSIRSADDVRRDGFRAGIEAAAKWLETVPQELQDRQIIVRNIRALAEQKDGEQ